MPRNELDDHRTWEAGYLGAKVLVQRDVLPDLYNQNFMVKIDPNESLTEKIF